MAEFTLPAAAESGAPSLLPRSASAGLWAGAGGPAELGRSQGAIRAQAAWQLGKDFGGMSFDFKGLDGDHERWMVVIQSTHMLFCDCKNYRQHLLHLLGVGSAPWRTGPSDGGDGGAGGGDTEGDTTDAALVAALDAAEGTGGEDTDG